MNNSSMQCPICSLYLLPGMMLEEHLETHPKEQVIQALVRLASSKSGGNLSLVKSLSNSASTSPSVVPQPHQPPPQQQQTQHHQQQQQKPKPRSLLALLPPPPPPQQFSSGVPRNAAGNGTEFVTDSTFNVMGQISNNPHQITGIAGASKNMMIVNRQNTLVYHQTGGNNFQHPPFQIFNYQPTASKPMQPPPTYGTAISQLRSQSNQINNNLNTFSSNVATNYIQNLQNFNSSIGSSPNNANNNHHHLNHHQTSNSRSTSRRSSLSPRVNFSPRPSPSPSVLRYAESPVMAQFTESDNGNFIVQESPRHVVEYIEKENGEMAVTEKIVEFKPSVVAISEESRQQFQDEENQAESEEEQQKPEEETPTPTTMLSKEKEYSKPEPSSNKSTFKVLSNVQVNQNEYKDLYENLFPFNKSIKSEKTFTESMIQETTPVAAIETTSSLETTATTTATTTTSKTKTQEDVQQITSVIRATPGCSKNMYNKKAPKKLVIKNKKRLQVSQEVPKSKEEITANQPGTRPGIAAPTTTQNNEVLDTNKKTEQPKSPAENEEIEYSEEDNQVKIEKLDENARASPIPLSLSSQSSNTESAAHLQTFEITTNIVDSEIFNEDAVEEFTSNYHNDNSSIHVNFPTSSSSLDGSEIIIPYPIQDLKEDVDEARMCTTEIIQVAMEETHIVKLKNEKDGQDSFVDKSKESDSSSQEHSQNTPPLFPLSAIFSKPSTSASVFKNDFRESEDQKPSSSNSSSSGNFNDFSSYSFLYQNSDGQKVKMNSSLDVSDIEEHESDKNNYLDLDTCKGGYSQIMDTLNIQTDEKMPAKGEISEQESNGDIENSWNHSVYNESSSRFPNPYEAFMSGESWSHEEYFQPQEPNLPAKLRVSPPLSLHKQLQNCTQSSSSNDVTASTSLAGKHFPSTSAGKPKKIRKTIISSRTKTFACEHCQTVFAKLKERNAHLIKVHNYVRVNRRLYRNPPSATETSQSLNNTEDISKIDIKPNISGSEGVKIEKIESEDNDHKNLFVRTTTAKSMVVAGTTKYDSIRAQLYRMLMNFNLGVKKETTNEEIDSHFLESHSFCCYTCKQDFISVKLYDEHLATHPAECFTCHKKFSRWHYFSVHLKRHLGWKDFVCTICNKKFVVKGALLEHMRMHTGESPLKCKICSKSFKRYSNLTQHVRVIHGNKKRSSKDYVCYCGAVLPSKARFLWHKEIHDVKPKCCQYCRDRFIHMNSLRRHIRLAHADKFDYNEPVECPHCKQVYSKGSIKTHMATHSMDTQHECNICNKSFSTKWNLKIHSWVHANRTSKPYKCIQCTKAFVREIDFQNHINSHKQIKPFTCEYCGCKFIRKYNYMRHWREHQNDKKFSCDVCGKAFHRRYYLIEHSRIHTGERPFLCTICGKSSTTKTNHNKHLKIHNSRDPFTSEA